MDNKNNAQKPRKKVTKEVLRRRQLTALAVIAIIVLIFVILIANACTDKSGTGRKKETTSSTTTTTTTTTTEIFTEPPTTVTTAPPAPIIDPNLSAMVQLSTREITLAVGESDMPYIYGYPEGSSEANEVWTSSDPNIATVNDMGNVTAVNAGECNIILTFDNNPAIEVQIKITVTGSAENPENPETPVDTQPDVNVPDGQENQDYQENQENQDYQNAPENPATPNDPSSLYQNTQGFQDTQNFSVPEQSADNQNPDDSQT
ncbi:MAG: Ig-like domain-containing protein [Ruminococcus sp.]|nr:Ig-like domain-containing protein [Ruminococcus sp.]